jgi:hypothetical protein
MLQPKSHTAAEHTANALAGVLHTWPQLPQFIGFCRVSTQLVPHSSNPALHSNAQLESTQVGLPFTGLGHAVSQLPQWFAEPATSRQAPPQLRSPESQASRHTPFEQTRPAAQVVSQSPQWLGSLRVSVHRAPHSSSGALQVT